MDELHLRDGEGYIAREGSAFETRKCSLQEVDVGFVRGRGNQDSQVVQVGED